MVSPDAVVGVGRDGYTFSDGSTPQARDDNAALVEALDVTVSALLRIQSQSNIARANTTARDALRAITCVCAETSTRNCPVHAPLTPPALHEQASPDAALIEALRERDEAIDYVCRLWEAVASVYVGDNYDEFRDGVRAALAAARAGETT